MAWKRGVRAEERIDVRAVGEHDHLVDERLQPGELVGPEPRHGELDRERLQRLAQLVGREELLRRERGDDGAAARAHGHEALRGEAADRLAHRSPGDAERLRERDLVELAARRQAVVEDLLAQVLVHALPQRQVLDPGSTGGVDALLALVGRHCNHFPHRV